MQRLNKSAVLNGATKREQVEIDGLDGVIYIRPLTDGELAEVRSVSLKGLSTEAIRQITRMQQISGANGDLEEVGLSGDDLMTAQANNAAGDRIAASYGMSCDGETWTPDEVGQLGVGVPAKIAAEVYALSGLGAGGEKAARQFREDAGDGGDIDPA